MRKPERLEEALSRLIMTEEYDRYLQAAHLKGL